ncbi:MAG TPA: DUF4845 domain-containing protein [Burkholderiales bacterium]|nr:DUF4845 domain-containing protein [Burkholderiales bacterium]
MKHQRGMSLSGLIFISFLLIIVALLGFKLLPAYIEYFTVKKALKEIAANPETNGTSKDVRSAFTRRGIIENITAVTPEDIEIARDGNEVVLSTAWSVKIPLVQNISACIDFQATSR